MKPFRDARALSPFLRSFLALGVATAPFMGGACGTEYQGGGLADASVDGTAVDGGGDSTSLPDALTCKAGEVVTKDGCCAQAAACGGACCAASAVCSFDRCVVPTTECFTSDDCAPTEMCASLGSKPGTGSAACQQVQVTVGKCLAKAPTCANGQTVGCVEACQVRPPASPFDPELKYSYRDPAPSTDGDSMSAPIVIQLTDDDCDGKVTRRDTPEIVYQTFYGGLYDSPGSLRVLSVQNGALALRWRHEGIVPGSTPAGGDLDGDGVPEIVACHTNAVVALRADGTQYWMTSAADAVPCGGALALADFDEDGSPEVVVGNRILNGKTGAVIRVAGRAGSAAPVIADIDGDGRLDLLSGLGAHRFDGTEIFDLASLKFNALGPAVADLDGDGKPELIFASFGHSTDPSAPAHQVAVLRYDAAAPSHYVVVRSGVDINNGTSTATFCSASWEYGAGPVTVADFDGDNSPDVGLAGAVGYTVLSGKKLMDSALTNAQTVLWNHPTHDCSSAGTGSSVFDFNGDGAAEVLYGDEYRLWLFDGKTGADLLPTPICNTNGTLQEYPVVADVDGDDQADIIAVSNAYSGYTCQNGPAGVMTSGLRVWSSASHGWTRTRRVWNEHGYHVTNISEDGRVPSHELPNWTQSGLNNYRQNKQPGQEWAAPDATVVLLADCTDTSSLVARVSNRGEAPIPAGAKVTVTRPDGTTVGSVTTVASIYPGGAVDLTVASPLLRADAGLTLKASVSLVGATDCRPGNDAFEGVLCPDDR